MRMQFRHTTQTRAPQLDLVFLCRPANLESCLVDDETQGLSQTLYTFCQFPSFDDPENVFFAAQK